MGTETSRILAVDASSPELLQGLLSNMSSIVGTASELSSKGIESELFSSI